MQVGGDYPTSPITGLSAVASGTSAVKVELEPKSDTLQTETPVLDWVEIEWVPAITWPRDTLVLRDYRDTMTLDDQRAGLVLRDHRGNLLVTR